MTIPLIILAVLSVVGGFIGVPKSLFGNNAIEHWLAPVFEPAQSKLLLAEETVHTSEYVLMVISLGIAVGGILLARELYTKRRELVHSLQSKYARIHSLLFNKYFVDEIYDASVVKPTVSGSEKLLWKGIDVAVIDGALDGMANLVTNIALSLRRIQTGVAQMYAVVFVGGIVFIIAWLIFR